MHFKKCTFSKKVHFLKKCAPVWVPGHFGPLKGPKSAPWSTGKLCTFARSANYLRKALRGSRGLGQVKIKILTYPRPLEPQKSLFRDFCT